MSGLQPLSPPAKDWVEPPSLPPPSIQQRFTSDGAFRCEAMGIVDPAGCCETSGIERFCCQPCRLVWLNVSSSQLTERGRHYRAQQCLPQEAAVLGRHEIGGGGVVTVTQVVAERCWATRTFGAIEQVGMVTASSLALLALGAVLSVCCVFAGCPLYWKRLALASLNAAIGEYTAEQEHADRMSLARNWRAAAGRTKARTTAATTADEVAAATPHSRGVGATLWSSQPAAATEAALVRQEAGRATPRLSRSASGTGPFVSARPRAGEAPTQVML